MRPSGILSLVQIEEETTTVSLWWTGDTVEYAV